MRPRLRAGRRAHALRAARRRAGARPTTPATSSATARPTMALGGGRARSSTRSALVAEAGTGVGKTFAYLVPALLSGARALRQHRHQDLQDQLFCATCRGCAMRSGVPVRTALLKGRASYLCLHRMELARQRRRSFPTASRCARWRKIEQWAHGDDAPATSPSCEGLDERSPVIPLVTSTRENCLGSAVPEVPRLPRDEGAARGDGGRRRRRQPPPVLRRPGAARQRAWPSCCRRVDVAVFDEAHQLAETGVQFLGRTLGTGQAARLRARPAGRRPAAGARPGAVAQTWPRACERAARELRLAAAGPLRAGARQPQAALRRSAPQARGLRAAALAAMRAGLRRGAARRSTRVSEIGARLRQAAPSARGSSRSAGRALRRPAAARATCAGSTCRRTQARLVESPLDIARRAARADGEAAPRRPGSSRRPRSATTRA